MLWTLLVAVFMTGLPLAHQASLDEATYFVLAAKVPRLRSLEEFARQEIVLPNGPYAGAKLRESMQPSTFVWLRELDRRHWRRRAFTGPVQSGKTLSALVIPLMHTLFERRETAILGAPKLEIAHDKWREDFLPVIRASRYAGMLPSKGAGSRGGTPQDHVVFGNGATLKFMSGQGSDDARSAFTSRWVYVTETDKMDLSTDASREADPVAQLEDRTFAFDRLGGGFVSLECTCSVESGRIWQEVTRGTDSRLGIRCRYCRAFVTPEREHFVGWQMARNEAEAAELGHFMCPACGHAWTQDDRLEANLHAILLHKGQRTDRRGRVSGDVPAVGTLGFRMSAANNALVSDATIAIREWQAAQHDPESPSRVNLEKTLRQKIWALPYDPPSLDDLAIDWRKIKERSERLPKGLVPGDTLHLTLGVDLRKRYGHWVAVAWRQAQHCHVVDYGAFDIPSDDLGVEPAMRASLRDFRELCESGWTDQRGGALLPTAVWIDAGWMGHVVYAFCRESGSRYLPTIGRGASQHLGAYVKPKRTGKTVREIGHDYHVEWSDRDATYVVMVNSDSWKTFAHRRLTTPVERPGAMTLYDDQGDKNCHTSFAKHVTAEREGEQFVPGKGRVTKWVSEHKSNHWFDGLYLACAAGHFAGWSLVDGPAPIMAQATQTSSPAFRLPDGRPYLATERT